MKAFGLLSVLNLVGISFIFSGIDLIAFASSRFGRQRWPSGLCCLILRFIV